MEQQFRFKKKYGQNFLKNKGIIEKIVSVAMIKSNSLIIEVGPGAGSLTELLAESNTNVKVLAYEIDDSLEDILGKAIRNHSNVKVCFQDFLQSDLTNDVTAFSYEHLYFVSNVPYYITTPILFKLIDNPLYFDKIVMMVQKEVGDRFCAKPGKKEYGALTVLLNYYYLVKKEFIVDRNQFIPRPNVDSVVVSFVPRKEKECLLDENHFKKLVHDSFQYKRKTIRNNLKNYNLDVILTVLQQYNYDLSIRAEQLDFPIFVAISNALLGLKNKSST